MIYNLYLFFNLEKTNNLKEVIEIPRRICDACGKERDVSGGKTCENGHFTCSHCVHGGILDPTRSVCPICKKPLR